MIPKTRIKHVLAIFGYSVDSKVFFPVCVMLFLRSLANYVKISAFKLITQITLQFLNMMLYNGYDWKHILK